MADVRYKVHYEIATYEGDLVVVADEDADREHVIARARAQLRQRCGHLPFGAERWVVERDRVNDEKLCVILLRRPYAGFEASVHPLGVRCEHQLSIRALVFSGTLAECEAWARSEGWRVIETTHEALDTTDLVTQEKRWTRLRDAT